MEQNNVYHKSVYRFIRELSGASLLLSWDTKKALDAIIASLMGLGITKQAMRNHSEKEQHAIIWQWINNRVGDDSVKEIEKAMREWNDQVAELRRLRLDGVDIRKHCIAKIKKKMEGFGDAAHNATNGK